MRFQLSANKQYTIIFGPTGGCTLEQKEKIDSHHKGDFLWKEERKLMHHFMMLQNEGFAWEDQEQGKLWENFFPPIDIPVVLLIMLTVSREVQCTSIKQNNNESYSWIVQLLNCLGVSCGFVGFCSNYSSGRCLVEDGGCRSDGGAYGIEVTHCLLHGRRRGCGSMETWWYLTESVDKWFIWMKTGEAYNGGFFIIKAVDFDWRGE